MPRTSGVCWTFIFFVLLGGDNQLMLMAGIVLGPMCHSFMYGPQAAFVVERFSPRLHSTGSSLAHTFAGVIGGAIAPLLFTLPLSKFGGWIPVARYVAVAGAVPLAGLALGRDPHPTQDDEFHTALETAWPSAARPQGCSATQQDVPRDVQVMANGRLGLLAITLDQGIEEVLVFAANMLTSTTGAEQRVNADHHLAHMELAVGPGDQFVAGRVDELLVERRVEPDELPRRFRLVGRRQVGLLLQGLGHRLGRNVPRADGETGCVAFQYATQFHELGYLATGDHGDVGTTLRNQFDQPVGNQQQQGLAHGGSGHADFGCQLLPIEELPLHR